MDDKRGQRPDHRKLFDIASEWRGYFTASQARECGFRANLLNHHVKNGRFRRIRRGLYRIADYPDSQHDDLIEALLIVGVKDALISHQSALDVLELSDVIPDQISITVPRSRRYVRRPSGVRIFTTSNVPGPRDRIERAGIRLTSATRSILDSAEAGMATEQVALAAWQAIDRGLASADELDQQASDYGRYVRETIRDALEFGPR